MKPIYTKVRKKRKECDALSVNILQSHVKRIDRLFGCFFTYENLEKTNFANIYFLQSSRIRDVIRDASEYTGVLFY